MSLFAFDAVTAVLVIPIAAAAVLAIMPSISGRNFFIRG